MNICTHPLTRTIQTCIYMCTHTNSTFLTHYKDYMKKYLGMCGLYWIVCEHDLLWWLHSQKCIMVPPILSQWDDTALKTRELYLPFQTLFIHKWPPLELRTLADYKELDMPNWYSVLSNACLSESLSTGPGPPLREIMPVRGKSSIGEIGWVKEYQGKKNKSKKQHYLTSNTPQFSCVAESLSQ